MDPEMFSQMVEDLTPKLQKKTTNCRKPLSPGLKLAITVGYLATGDSYKSLAYGFRVAPNTIVSVVLEVCQAIYDHYHETAFKCPTTEEQWTEVAQGLSDKWNFHHCCGCIDGKHVRMQAPPHSGSLYYNYKGFYSIIMLALVDANCNFLYVDVMPMVLIPMLASSGSVDCIMLWSGTKLVCHQVNHWQVVTLKTPTSLLVTTHVTQMCLHLGNCNM